jgi:uncharacterized Zn-binding protein involved in type VI secretion
MSNSIARLGDTSDHGGYIASVSTTRTYCNGVLVARLGDMHSCPIPGHGVTQLVSSPVSTISAEGAQLAMVGARAGCGATINGGSPSVVVQ